MRRTKRTVSSGRRRASSTVRRHTTSKVRPPQRCNGHTGDLLPLVPARHQACTLDTRTTQCFLTLELRMPPPSRLPFRSVLLTLSSSSPLLPPSPPLRSIAHSLRATQETRRCIPKRRCKLGPCLSEITRSKSPSMLSSECKYHCVQAAWCFMCVGVERSARV